MGYYNSCRDELLEVAKDVISRKGKNEFTVLEIVKAMEEHGTVYKESTIRTHITSKCCVNAPANHNERFSDYQRIEHGLYKVL